MKDELLELETMVQDIDLQLFKKGEEERLHSDQKECEAINDRKNLVDQIRLSADETLSKLNGLDHLMIQLSQLTNKSVTFDSETMIEKLNMLHHSMTQESLEIEYLEAIDLDEINARLNQILKQKLNTMQTRWMHFLKMLIKRKIK